MKNTAVFATYRICIAPRSAANHPKLHKAAHNAGITELKSVSPNRLFFLEGNLTPAEVENCARGLLADPVTEELSIVNSQSSIANGSLTIDNWQLTIDHFIETTLLPGVTDPPAENLVRAAHHLGITGLKRAATGTQFLLTGKLSDANLQQLATNILANPVIHRFTINETIEPPFFPHQENDNTFDVIPVRNADDEGLLAISRERRLALDLAEMQAIQSYYLNEDRDADRHRAGNAGTNVERTLRPQNIQSADRLHRCGWQQNPNRRSAQHLHPRRNR